ncbi:MAG: hypothetical protein HC852_23480 [Acaryochloridaceae cyanobacterium RU_4_10]|nr:hypothetical protein [Acaryochloridaceae cyanobacterium RU_4_10]
MGGVLAILAIATLALFFKKVQPAVIDKQGVPALTRPLQQDELSRPEAVRASLENRLPRFYTWVGVLLNKDDPTGTTFVKDEGMGITRYDRENKKMVNVGKVPTTVYNEQFYLSEPIRNSTLAAIAQLIDKTNNVIWQTNPNNPSLGISYRFKFRGRPSYPKEVSSGRWKTIVTGDIVKVSPTLGLVPTEKIIQTFSYEVYLVEVSKQPTLFVDNDKKDLVAYGCSDGFNIDLMIPYEPNETIVPSPK